MTALTSLRPVVLTLLTTLTVLAAPAAHSDPQVRPFKATLTTHETLAANPVACPLSVLQGTTSGQGNASHMGKITLSATDCVTLGASQFTFTNGVLMLLAANGDTLVAEYSGALLPSAAYPVYTLSGTYRVTGGTGRFSSATGAGSMQGTTNITTGQGTFVATGTLGY
ncbi:MAG: hypothetical protein H7274_06290 [Rhodoferax sp.]|nr:hypothetical protein [Rhodoferax sp.]